MGMQIVPPQASRVKTTLKSPYPAHAIGAQK